MYPETTLGGPMARRSWRSSATVLALALATVLVTGWAATAGAQLEDRLEALDSALGSLFDGTPVSLDECIEVAILGSATLGIAEEDLEAAKKDVLASFGEWLPNLNFSASWARTQRVDVDGDFTDFDITSQLVPFPLFDSAGNPLLINGQQAFQSIDLAEPIAFEDRTSLFTNTSGTLQTGWTLFDGFRRLGSMKAAKATRDANARTLDYQKSLLVQNVTVAYYDLLRAKRQVTVNLEAEDLARQELERSETYFELGIATRSDVLQAKVRHEQTRLETVQARNGERQAFVELSHLMNIPGVRTFDVEPLGAASVSLQVPDLQTVLEGALATRDDIEASIQNVRASEGRLTQARAGYYPSVNLFGSYGLSESKSPQDLRFGAQETRTTQWGVSVNWDIFDRFQTVAASRRGVADLRRAEYNLRQARLDAEKEIVQLYNTLVDAAERYQVASGTIEQSEEDLRLAEERFRVGAGTSLDVITAQVNLTRARTDSVTAVADYYKARAQLTRATGRTL